MSDDQYELELDDAASEQEPPRQVVQRFELYPSPGVTTLKMPHRARFLHAGFGKAGIAVVHLWFLVDPTEEKAERRFRALGTGDALPVDYEYVGTAQDPSMSKAWHVFEDMTAVREEMARLFVETVRMGSGVILPNFDDLGVTYERDPDVPSYPRLDSTPDRSDDK